jgi:squalene-hopene/tetraprenyl-beta-curcumene cyclase
MEALGDDAFLDAQGQPHDWQADLFAALKTRQRPDGSWASDNRAFMETSPELATAYALLALSYFTPPRQ